MKTSRLTVVLPFLACLTLSAFDQDVPPSPQQPANPPVSTIKVPPPPEDPDMFRVSSEVELVLLDVSVKDPKGGFVSGLKKENFKVFENKMEQPIRTFGSQDTPVTVGLVIDNSASIRPKKPEILTAALTFITQSNPQDEMFIINFNDRVYKGLPDNVKFTGDRNLLREAMLHNQPQGRTALYDAIKTGLDHLEEGHLDKKTLIVISDGGDNSSDLTRNSLIRMAEESLATIYTIGIFDPGDRDKNPGFLKELARVTGGEAFLPNDSEERLVGVCEKIAKDIRSRYSVGFTPAADHKHDGKRRYLKVLVTAEGGGKFEARTRTHYIPTSDPVEARTQGKSK